MYSKFQLAKKYLRYYLTASNGKGHGIHSPFVFDLIKHVLQDRTTYDSYQVIEHVRKHLLHQTGILDITDLGAGSTVIKKDQRVVADIAASSLKPKKYAQLLHRVVQYYKPATILELGTSFGITTAYLATGNENSKVYTIEGSEAIAGIAKNTFRQLAITNIELITGDFDTCLPALLGKLKSIDLAFIDGNHRKQPTLDYFQQLIKHAAPSTILVFDDIHWSAEMEEAWEAIKQHHAVTLTLDLFFIGIVFFNTDINHKQHYTIRF